MNPKTKATYTPGPWKIELASVGFPKPLMIFPEDQVNYQPIAKIFPMDTPSMTEANARLVAAAPKLLEALRIMIDAVNVDQPDSLIVFASIEKAKAAIAKAEGKQS